MVDIINIALLIIGLILTLRLFKWVRKRLRLIARLQSLAREYGGKVKFLRFPLLPTRVKSIKPDAYVRICDTVYLIRLYSGRSKHYMVHFASEKFSVRYMKMALRMLASPRRPGKGIAYAEYEYFAPGSLDVANSMEEKNETLAVELLHELKLSARRWFLAFIVMVILEISTILGFVWYISLPVEEYSLEQSTDRGGDNFNIGGDYNGTTEN